MQCAIRIQPFQLAAAKAAKSMCDAILPPADQLWSLGLAT